VTAGEVLILAGEASGDMHAAPMAEALRAARPALHLSGVGGPRLRAVGQEQFERAERIAVVGLVEVVKHLPVLRTLMRAIRARLDTGRVRLVVLVDYPGFNLRVAREAKRRGIPVLYFITPQVWAWHKSRLAGMRETITRAAVILPFEEAILRAAGIDARFVGSPLVEHAASLPSRAEACATLGLDAARPVLALFPGSRGGELARHLDDFVATAHAVRAAQPSVQVVVSGASTVRIDPARCPFPVVREQSWTVLRAATAAMCKSGTTTLEAAVAGTPLVVCYRTAPLTYAIAKRVVTLPNIGLVNIVAGRRVAPEFVQHELSASRVAPALLPLLDEASEARRAMVAALAEVRATLGEPGASRRTAAIALEMLA
jgi:lipid-A-disaccharide synthase